MKTRTADADCMNELRTRLALAERRRTLSERLNSEKEARHVESHGDPTRHPTD
jgi:hypothetical protein